MKDPVPTDIPLQRPAARNNIYLICILISCTLMTDWPMRAQRVASSLGNVHLFRANGICYVNVSTTSWKQRSCGVYKEQFACGNLPVEFDQNNVYRSQKIATNLK